MAQIACWYDVTADASKLGEYLQKLGVGQVICDARHVASAARPQHISRMALRKFKASLAEDGIELAAVTVGWVRGETLDPVKGRAERKRILQNIEALGAGKVPVAQMFVMVKNGSDAAARKQQWAQLIDYCKQVATTARKAKVKVGIHGSQDRDHLITDLKAYRKLLTAVPTKALGVTLCLGCLAIQYSDPARALRALGDRVHFLHARDIILKRDGSWVDVNLGEGQIDYRAVKRAIDKIGYRGPFQPEHLGHISFEKGEEITMARAVGFLRALLDPAPKSA